jgi:hypothetical protein
LIAYLTSKSNKEARSTIIVSNDYDIKQLVNYGTTPLYINMMTNECIIKKNYSYQSYKTFINIVSKLPNDDIFNLNDNSEF